jgi:acyl-CoA synthetase (AMP-forming)/AMP-acid ligase II
MRLRSFEAVATALEAAAVRYLVAGGLAVNAHGYLRFTKDVDVVIQLEPDNLRRALAAVAALGYRPAVPVPVESFLDPDQRAAWVRDKGMQVFQLWSDEHPETSIDVFVTEPFDFDAEYRVALVKPLRDDLPVRFVSLPTLIRMKELAGRAQDRLDVEQLRLRRPADD